MVRSQSRGQLGRGIVDSGTGAARITFVSPLENHEQLSALQSICGHDGPVAKLPAPDPSDRVLSAPTIKGSLHACERAVRVEGVAEGATVRLFRDGHEYAAACFDYPSLWFRIADPLRKDERIKVDQHFPDCEPQARFPTRLRLGRQTTCRFRFFSAHSVRARPALASPGCDTERGCGSCRLTTASQPDR